MASENILTLDNANFQQEIDSDTPTLVDFWAAWCGPCKTVAPVLEEIASEMEGKVRIAKLDIDANQEIASRFDVQGIPTFLLFQNGEIKDRMMGALPKSAFQRFIDRNI